MGWVEGIGKITLIRACPVILTMGVFNVISIESLINSGFDENIMLATFHFLLVVCTSAMLGVKNNRNRLHRNRILFPKDKNFIVLTNNMADVQTTNYGIPGAGKPRIVQSNLSGIKCHTRNAWLLDAMAGRSIAEPQCPTTSPKRPAFTK